MIIAIDGPAASGKSTTAKLVAKKLNFFHLDTGAMYRAATLFFQTEKTDLANSREIENTVRQINFSFPDARNLIMNGSNVSHRIRSVKVTESVSEISALPQVRERMVQMQREIALHRNIVVEGRDIGTHVFPGAEFKFFIIADVKERALRRFHELQNKSVSVRFQDVLSDLKERDRKDTLREISPLKKAEDAIIIDTTEMTIDEQVDKIVSIINNKNHKQE